MAQHSLPYAAEQPSDHRVIDYKGETIVLEATILKEEIERHLRASYRAEVGSLVYCIYYPCVKRQARNVAETWRLYVTEKTLCLYFVGRNLFGCSTPREKRIPLADITDIAVNEEIEFKCCCGLIVRRWRTGVNTMVVTYKKGEEICCCSSKQLYAFYTFKGVANAEEFAEAVRRQMAALGNTR